MKAEEMPPQEKSQTSPKGRGKPLRRIVLLLLFLVLAVSALLWSRISQVEEEGPQDARLPIPKVTHPGNPVVAFDPFLIPLGEKSKYTFIVLSFSLEWPRGESVKEIKEKLGEVRGIIYDSLKEEFHKKEGIPLIQEVKDSIERAVRLTLPGQQVKGVYVSQFLAL